MYIPFYRRQAMTKEMEALLFPFIVVLAGLSLLMLVLALVVVVVFFSRAFISVVR